MNPTPNKYTHLITLGKIDFKEAWDFQTRLFNQIIETKTRNRNKAPKEQELTNNYLIFCEHPHVYTLGKSGNASNLLISETRLKQREATYYKINRGGDITYHGPGQIIAYPILDLDNFFTDIHKYMRFLEEAVILTLKEYGIQGHRLEKATGVWLDPETPDARKICAMGVKTSRWVTMHGLALNVNTDLSYFDDIVPCGIADKSVTSIEQELREKVETEKIQQRLKHYLSNLFEMKLVSEKAPGKKSAT